MGKSDLTKMKSNPENKIENYSTCSSDLKSVESEFSFPSTPIIKNIKLNKEPPVFVLDPQSNAEFDSDIESDEDRVVKNRKKRGINKILKRDNKSKEYFIKQTGAKNFPFKFKR